MLVSEGLKSEAIRRITGSVTFHRADVLRALIEYLHTQESLGRAHEVTESEIALNVMGRGQSFSPESDSSVRTRFLALRKKLDEYYASEGRDEKVRLDIPRGTYKLRFVQNVVESTVEEPVEVAQVKPSGRETFFKGIVVGVAMVAIGGLIWSGLQARRGVPAEGLLKQAWGPMLEAGSDVTIVLGTPASFFVRDFGNAEPPLDDPVYTLPFDRNKQFEEWYQRTRNLQLGKTALLHPNAHSPLWGDAAAASLLSRMFGEYGVRVDQAPGARVHPVALRERDTVIIGRPEYTDAARDLIPEDGMVIEYSAKDRLVGVHNRRPQPGEKQWWFAGVGSRKKSYGLITVLGHDERAKKRLILFSGINSDGAEAGARFFSSPEKLAVLDGEFRKRGLEHWPVRYQIVVQTHSVDTYSLQSEFEFLKILK